VKLLAKKVAFSISRGKNQISPLLALPGKNFGKISYWPLLEKILPTLMNIYRVANGLIQVPDLFVYWLVGLL